MRGYLVLWGKRAMPAVLRWAITTPVSILVSALLATTAGHVPVAYAQVGP